MTSLVRSDPDLVVLHTLRCCGAASTERLAAAIDPWFGIDVEDLLLALGAQGLVAHGAGAFGGWRLTDAGRAADAQRIAVELDRAEARSDVQSAYEAFLPLNRRTLDICGEWQVRKFEQPLVLNDHSDKVYDGGVLARLAAVNADAQPICAGLAARLHRFAPYGPRLASALDRARQGEVALVTDTLDSYHSVWFQLHEDLLVTLGMGRGD